MQILDLIGVKIENSLSSRMPITEGKCLNGGCL